MRCAASVAAAAAEVAHCSEQLREGETAFRIVFQIAVQQFFALLGEKLQVFQQRVEVEGDSGLHLAGEAEPAARHVDPENLHFPGGVLPPQDVPRVEGLVQKTAPVDLREIRHVPFPELPSPGGVLPEVPAAHEIPAIAGAGDEFRDDEEAFQVEKAAAFPDGEDAGRGDSEPVQQLVIAVFARRLGKLEPSSAPIRVLQDL